MSALEPAPVVWPHPGAAPQRPELPAGVPALPPWRPWTAPAALVSALAATLAAGILVAIVVALAGGDIDRHNSAADITLTFIQDAALVGAAVLFARRGGLRARAGQFGLRPTAPWRGAGLAAAGLVTSIVFTAIWALALDSTPKEHVVEQLGAGRESVTRYVVALLVCVAAPVAEEVFFRGYFFTALRNWRGTPLAVLLTGITFGLVHVGSAPLVYLVPLAVLGAILCLLYLRTGSLYPGLGLHCVNNALAFGVTIHWGWQIPVLMASSLALIAALATGVMRLDRRGSPPLEVRAGATQ